MAIQAVLSGHGAVHIYKCFRALKSRAFNRLFVIHVEDVFRESLFGLHWRLYYKTRVFRSALAP